MKHKLFTLFLALVASVGTIFASDTQVNGIWYEFDSNTKTASVTYSGDDYESDYFYRYEGSVNIPAVVEYNGVTYSVTSIGDYAFFGCYDLTSVTIPNSVTNMDFGVFYGCKSLTSITCKAVNPPSLVSDVVFYAVNKTIPLYVPYESIELYKAADQWNDFINIETIPGTEPCIIFSGYCGAEGDSTNLRWELSCDSVLTIKGTGAMANYNQSSSHAPWYSHTEKIKEIIIQDGVSSIGNSAFSVCSSLKNISMPNSITRIGELAFNACYILESIDFKEGLKTIGTSAFNNCGCLSNIYIPKSVTNIGQGAFAFCKGISSIIVNPDNIKYDSRNNCNAINTTESNSLIIGCKSTIIPDNVTRIESRAFNGCSDLTSINIPTSVTYIGSYAFNGTRLVHLTIPHSVITIGLDAFRACKQLESIIVDANNPIYDSRNDCNGLIKTETNTLVTGCMTTVIPNTITCIGSSAFYGQTNLTSIEIPTSVTNIEAYAFSACEKMSSITIPKTVTNIGTAAFWTCTALKEITCQAVNPPTLGSNVFYSVKKSIPLYVPAESIEAYKAADQWKDFTNILPIKCLLASGTCGAEGDSTNLRWELSCDSVLTIKGTGAMGHYSSSQYPWYSYNQIIKSLVIEEGVTNVWEWAFAYTTNLRSISLPTSLTRIERNAFANQQYLSTIHIPENVSYIGMGAFERCRALSAFSVAQENRYFSEKEGVLFNKNQSTLIAYPLKKDGSTYSVPAGVDSIGRESFYGSTLLQHIYLPDGVKYIGPQAFRECSLLEEMTIPASANLVNSGAFSGCDKLSSLIVEEGNTTYDSRNNCNAIIQTKTNTLIAGINNTVIPSDVVKIAEDAFFHRTGMTEMVIPNGVTSIEKRGFAECSNLVSIHIPSSVTFIDGWAFSQCRLDTVILPASVTAIGNCVFQRCNLRYFVNYAQTPQTVTKLSFNNCDLSDCTLYVPANSIDLYKVADGWKDFGYIEAIDGTESCILVSGTCGAQGDNLTWELSCDSVLTIKGTGAMADFKYPNYSPWYTYPSLIKSAILSEDITYIGKFAFYKCTSLTSITIPNSVTSVGNSAFSGCSGLTSVTIGNSVTSLGMYAFSECSGLTSITLPNSVMTIGDNAFYKCSGLTSITIPYSVTSVGSSAFYKCSGLTAIMVDAANPNYCDVDGVLFNKDKTILIRYPIAKSATEYSIPNSVTTIGFMAFNDCGLTSVIIPSSVTTIKGEAFYSCRGLTSITISNELISIESDAFINCESLTSLTIPNAVIECFDPPFEGCTNLETLNLGDGAKFKSSEEDDIIIDGLGWHFNGNGEGIKNINIDPNNPYYSSIDGVVFDKTQTTILCFPYRRDDNSYVIPNSVTKISDCAFLACTGLTSVAIPNSVTSLGVSAFAGCSGLTALTCEAITPPTCGTNVFYRVDKSIPLYVPAESIDAYKAADQWKDFTNILPIKCVIASGTCGAEDDNLTWELSCDSVLTISGTGEMIGMASGEPWENHKSAIRKIVIEEGVTSIAYMAFRYMDNLTEVVLANSVERTDTEILRGCDNIKYPVYNDKIFVYLPRTYVGEYVVPDGINSIEYAAFIDCKSLTFVSLPNSLKCVHWGAFEHSGVVQIILPEGVQTLDRYAFIDCDSLRKVVIPSTVQQIGFGIFAGDKVLSEVIVDENNKIFDSRNNCNAIIETATNTLIAGCKNTIIPENVEVIDLYAFAECGDMASIVIPESVIEIKDYAIYRCTALTSVTNYAVFPQKITSDAFYDVDKSACNLYVPYESIEFYKLTDVWYEFANILPIPGTEPCIVASGTCGAEGDNLTWEISCDSVLTISGTGEMKDFTNPDDSPWRLYFYKFKSAVINEGVTSIGDYAFSLCTILTSIEIPNSVTRIGSQAFADCSDLTSVVIPNGVSEIREGTFARCSGLISVTLPNGVLSIGLGSFTECSHLTSFEIPNSVTEIGENAFHGCSSLTSITIPNNVTSIGDYAFQGCSGLTSLTVGKELTSMGSTAFEGCNNLTYVNITDLAAWCKINFRSYGACNPLWLSKNLYLNGELVTDLVIPDGVTSISTCAFYGCSGLTSVTIPNSVTSIGKYVFYQCSGLTSVTIPNSVTEIGEYTFYGCTNLPVFDNIRYADTYLASVADKSLSAYSIKDGTKWIGTRAFSDCASLTSIEIPNSVTTLGEEAFSGCMSLTSVSIPNSVTRIGEIAFGMCSNLTSITIPNSVTSIGSVAFDACTGLTSITCEALTLPTLGNKVFKNVDKSIPLYVPYECIDLYKTADQWKDFTNIRPIPGTEPVYYKLTLEVNDDMMGSVSGAGRYLEGEEVMLEAIANETYRFAGWYNEKDELLSNQWNYTLSLNSDRTLKAVFEPIPMSSELAMIYVQGQAVEHFVSDNFNYTFRYPAHTPESALPTSSDITFDKGDEYQTVIVSQSGSTIIVNVTSGRGMTKAYVLNFVIEVPNQFTVTALSSNDEWGYVEGSGSYDENSEVSITAIPNDGYQFYNWNNSITENPHSFVLTRDTSFIANFLPNKTDEIVTAIGSNSILFEWERKPFAFGYWLYVYLDFRHTVWLCRVKFVGLWPLVLPVDFEWGPGYGPSYVAKVGEESEDVRRMVRARKTDDNVISYTLENLASSTEHFFTIEAFDEQEKVVDAQAGACKTKPQIPTAVDNIESEQQSAPKKILLNGQFYILRGDKMYTIDGKSLKQ